MKIIDTNVKKFGYNKVPFTMSSFFYATDLDGTV